MMRLKNLYERVRNRLLLERDLLNWRRQTAPLRKVDAQCTEKKVLFCNLMTMPATAKIEAVFAAAFALRGYRPIILLRHRYSPTERIFSATTDVDFIVLEDLIAPGLQAQAEAEADQLMTQHPDLGDLVRLELDGFRVGRNVQSLVVRKFRVGRLDSSNAEHRRETRRVMVDSLVTKKAASQLLDNVRPDLAIFLEKGYTPAAELFDACVLKGIDAIQWLGAPQADRLLFKRYSLENRSMHPLALSTESWEGLKAQIWSDNDSKMVEQKLASHYNNGAWFNRQQLQEGKTVKSAEEVRHQLGLDSTKKTAVVFAHILYDATFFYGDSLFEDYEQWLVETVRCAIVNPNLNWVVKVHPVNVWRSKMDGAEMEQLEAITLRRHFGELPPHVKIMPADSDINTYSLFHTIDYGLTVRGTIGMELPCFGIPVVTAGTGRYSGRGFTVDPPTPKAYRETLAHLHEVPPLDEETVCLARKYAYGTFFLRPLPITSFVLDFHASTYGLPALTQNVRLCKKAMGLWPDANDVNRIVDWSISGTREDLLANDSLVPN